MNLVDLLEKRGIEYRKTNNPSEILISCTSGQHVDKSPSLSFNLEKEMFHCWSCGFGGGTTKFLASIGETVILDFDSKHPYMLKKLKQKLEAKMELNTVQIPDDRQVFAEEFKGIDARVLKEFNTFTTSKMGLLDYVCIPVYQFGKIKFIEGRSIKNLANQPKYNRQPKNAVVADCLFPIDKIKNTNYVILVEGIFDMLNMWQLGYTNTLCIFGASNFSKKKLEMIDRLGVTRVDIMMDPDGAGQMAATKIASALDTKNIFSRIIKLPNGIDPGELTQKQAENCLR
jgi:DNA primase